MEKSSKQGLPAIVIGLIMLLMTSCAGVNSLSGNSNVREYEESYNDMIKIVERAIRGSTLGIVRSFENTDGFVIIVNQEEYVGNERVQSHQGEVKIMKVTSDTSAVQVINPQYHFSVPNHQRENYRRILFNRIEKVRTG